jgi:hypothetical protein
MGVGGGESHSIHQNKMDVLCGCRMAGGLWKENQRDSISKQFDSILGEKATGHVVAVPQSEEVCCRIETELSSSLSMGKEAIRGRFYYHKIVILNRYTYLLFPF